MVILSGIHNFLSESTCTTQQLCQKRLKLMLNVVKRRSVILLISFGSDSPWLATFAIGGSASQRENSVMPRNFYCSPAHCASRGIVELPFLLKIARYQRSVCPTRLFEIGVVILSGIYNFLSESTCNFGAFLNDVLLLRLFRY